MSESPEPVGPGGGSAGGGRYQRSSGGLIGALIVTVGAVVAFVVFRALTSDDEPTPVRAIDYSAAVQGARADGKLTVLAPEQIPPPAHSPRRPSDRPLLARPRSPRPCRSTSAISGRRS